jgi:hypothetical protein
LSHLIILSEAKNLRFFCINCMENIRDVSLGST